MSRPVQNNLGPLGVCEPGAPWHTLRSLSPHLAGRLEMRTSSRPVHNSSDCWNTKALDAEALEMLVVEERGLVVKERGLVERVAKARGGKLCDMCP